MHSRSQPAAAAALTDGVEMVAVGNMKVRKPYSQCSTVGGDCSQSHCCKVTNTYCWKTDTGGGQCAIKSKPGWPGQNCARRLCKHGQLALLLLRLQEEQGHLRRRRPGAGSAQDPAQVQRRHLRLRWLEGILRLRAEPG